MSRRVLLIRASRRGARAPLRILVSKAQRHETGHPPERATGTDLETIERLRIDAKSGRVERIRARQTGAA